MRNIGNPGYTLAFSSNSSGIQAQQQRHWVQGRCFKSIVRIKLFGLLVERMDEQGAHTGVLRYGHGPMHRVLQQPGAELDALRNRTLADRMDALHAQDGPAFVAVGSLHMVGAEGLPALLKARGFTVKRVF